MRFDSFSKIGSVSCLEIEGISVGSPLVCWLSSCPLPPSSELLSESPLPEVTKACVLPEARVACLEAGDLLLFLRGELLFCC